MVVGAEVVEDMAAAVAVVEDMELVAAVGEGTAVAVEGVVEEEEATAAAAEAAGEVAGAGEDAKVTGLALMQAALM